MNLHPKTGGAVVGGSLGVVVVSILGSIHGVHLSPEANAAIPTFLSAFLAWLVPAPTVVPAPVAAVPPPVQPPAA